MLPQNPNHHTPKLKPRSLRSSGRNRTQREKIKPQPSTKCKITTCGGMKGELGVWGREVGGGKQDFPLLPLAPRSSGEKTYAIKCILFRLFVMIPLIKLQSPLQIHTRLFHNLFQNLFL